MDSIEKDILRLRKGFCSVHAQAALAAKKIGYKFNLMWFLYALNDKELKSQKQICLEWGMSKTTLNTVVKECEKLGYINFQSIDGEKREKYIILTETGRKYMQKATEKMALIEKNTLLKLKDYKSFINQIEEFYQLFKSEIEELL